MQFIKALKLKTLDELDSNICVGDTIKIYGQETKVLGFYAAFNEGLMKWETIILTEGRGDPFERSLDVIEVLTPSESSFKKTNRNYQSPAPSKDVEAAAKPIYPFSLKGFEDMLEDFTLDHLKETGYSVGSEYECEKTYDEKQLRVKAAYNIILNGVQWAEQGKEATPVDGGLRTGDREFSKCEHKKLRKVEYSKECCDCGELFI